MSKKRDGVQADLSYAPSMANFVESLKLDNARLSTENPPEFVDFMVRCRDRVAFVLWSSGKEMWSTRSTVQRVLSLNLPSSPSFDPQPGIHCLSCSHYHENFKRRFDQFTSCSHGIRGRPRLSRNVRLLHRVVTRAFLLVAQTQIFALPLPRESSAQRDWSGAGSSLSSPWPTRMRPVAARPLFEFRSTLRVQVADWLRRFISGLKRGREDLTAQPAGRSCDERAVASLEHAVGGLGQVGTGLVAFPVGGTLMPVSALGPDCLQIFNGVYYLNLRLVHAGCCRSAEVLDLSHAPKRR